MTLPDLEARLRAAVSKQTAASSDFDLNAGIKPKRDRPLTPAAVLVCFRQNGSVILTQRSARLKHHPGQVAFPGGKMDPTDADLTAAALREAQEEIGLPANSARVIGHLPQHETVTGFAVTPVVSILDADFEIVPEAGEVSDVFDVPFDHIFDVVNYRVESRIWQGMPRYYYAVPYGPHYIWGATARMLRGLADRLAS